MRVSLRFVIAALAVALCARSRAPSCGEVRNSSPREASVGPAVYGTSDVAFAFDAAARINQSLVANIDALDTALTAILAGGLAALLFVFDRLPGRWGAFEVCATAVFGCSIIVSACGYFVGFWTSCTNRDGLLPRRLIPDLIERRDLAIAGALKSMLDVSETNMTIRLCKRVSAVAAILLIIAGMLMVAIARWMTHVVQ